MDAVSFLSTTRRFAHASCPLQVRPSFARRPPEGPRHRIPHRSLVALPDRLACARGSPATA